MLVNGKESNPGFDGVNSNTGYQGLRSDVKVEIQSLSNAVKDDWKMTVTSSSRPPTKRNFKQF